MEYKGYSGRKRDVYFEAPGFFLAPSEIESAEHGGVSLISGHRVVKLDLATQTAYLDDGRSLKYQKCLIATGRSLCLYKKSLFCFLICLFLVLFIKENFLLELFSDV